MRIGIKRNASDKLIEETIINTIQKIETMISDLMIEYSINISDSDFINKMTINTNLDIDFIKLFARKDNDIHNKFKYSHIEIAEFLGYEFGQNDGKSSPTFMSLIRNNLEFNTDYIIIDENSKNNLTVLEALRGGRGKKIIYYLTRIEFYNVCLISSKIKAKEYRRQFAKVYELALEYVQSLKNKLIQNLSTPTNTATKLSERINEKTEINTQSIKKKLLLLEKNTTYYWKKKINC